MIDHDYLIFLLGIHQSNMWIHLILVDWARDHSHKRVIFLPLKNFPKRQNYQYWHFKKEWLRSRSQSSRRQSFEGAGLRNLQKYVKNVERLPLVFLVFWSSCLLHGLKDKWNMATVDYLTDWYSVSKMGTLVELCWEWWT